MFGKIILHGGSLLTQHESFLESLVPHILCTIFYSDADQPNTKRNHANDPLEVPIRPITRARANKLKEALNGLVQNIWSKMDLEGVMCPAQYQPC
jgi:hypothetical protein